MFGGSLSNGSSDHLARSSAPESAQAWIVGLKGKVPYNLTTLLSAEKVRSAPTVRTVVPRILTL
jgi:hypothetical protein